jgi:predicted AlkP superfamily phosphohydrolase/phosphomutase
VTRVLAIGIDSAEWTHVESLLDAGLLPNLARLRSAGSWHPLVAEPGYRQSFALNQFLAGRSIRPRDRWEMCEFDGSTYSTYLRQSDQRPDCTAFYERVPGLRTIVFDVPWADVGRSPDVVGVVGWGAESPHHSKASRPANLIGEIEDRIGPHPLANFDRWGWHHPSCIDALVGSAALGAIRRTAALSMLQERFPEWELALVVMSETHAAGEFLWHGVDQTHPLAKVVDARHAAACLTQVYVDVDHAIGRMVDGCPADTTIVVFSLYGARCGGGDAPSVVLLPELLHRLSGADPVLRSADPAVWKAAGCPPLVPRRRDTWGDAIETLWMGPAEGNPVDRFLRRLKHIIPTRWQPPLRHMANWFGRRTASGFGQSVFDAGTSPDANHQDRGPNLDWNFCSRYRPWWPNMRAFAVHTFSEGMVRVNLAGREASGIVPLRDYEAACDEVEAAVRACTNPRTGRPAVREVIRAHPADPLDPNGLYADLIVVWDGPTDALEHPVAGLIGPVPFNRPGAHTSNAFAIVCPPAPSHVDNAPTEHRTAAAGDRTPGTGRVASAIDLPPTILSLLGRELPEGMEGSPLP